MMKYLWASFLILLICAEFGEARDYRVRKKTGGFTIDIVINRNPPVLGDNTIRIKIKDPQGNPVKGVKVYVNYYMPPMPGMPPMNYTIPAHAKDDEYSTIMKLIMRGPWNIVIKVKDGGKSWRIVFPIDVR